VSEAAALVAVARGDTAGALAELQRGEALAATEEERLRIAAMRGYVAHASDPAEAHAAFAAAVDHAVRAGAVVEEATYRTGEAAAAVDLGELGAAIATARRAALLWEHLGRPALAARALLAAAAAYATAGAAHDAGRAAREAMARARDGGDRRAEAYAWWAIADVSPPVTPKGSRPPSARRRSSPGAAPRTSSAPRRASSATARRRSRGMGAHRGAGSQGLHDADPAGPSAGARPRLVGTRAARLVNAGEDGAGDGGKSGVLAALVSLADTRAAPGTRGPALAAGHELAARAGRGDAAQRLLTALGEVARDLVRRAPPELATAVQALPWWRAPAPRARAQPRSGPSRRVTSRR